MLFTALPRLFTHQGPIFRIFWDFPRFLLKSGVRVRMMLGAIPILPGTVSGFPSANCPVRIRPCVLSVSSCCRSGVSSHCWGIRARTCWRTGWVCVVTSKRALPTWIPAIPRTKVTFARIVRGCMVRLHSPKMGHLLLRLPTIPKTVVSANGCSAGSPRCPLPPRRSRNNPGNCCSGWSTCGRFSVRRCRPSPVVRLWRDAVEDCADHS